MDTPACPKCGTSTCRHTKPCRGCGTPKTGRSPYCTWCRRDRADSVALTNDPEWLQRRATRHTRPARRPKTQPPDLHWCAGCREWLHPRWFLKWNDWNNNKPVPPNCRPCRSHKNHETRIRKQFGIDADTYNTLLNTQNGACAICRGTPRTARLAVDHDHTTGAIRGLLCSRCNTDLLGAAHDSITLLQRAIHYLQHPPAATALHPETPPATTTT